MALCRVEPASLELSLGRLRQFPERAIRSMVASLRSKGQLSPLVAAERDGALVLVDGFVRQLAALRLSMPTVVVDALELSSAQMKAQLYLRNRERGLFLLEECRIVRDLVEVEGLSQVEVGDLLERHKSWVSRRLSLIGRLSPRLVEEVQLGRLGGGSLRKLALLPACNQEELFAVATAGELSARDTELLIELWRKAPDWTGRQFLLQQPCEALRLARGKPRPSLDVRLGTGGEEVWVALEQMRRAGLRVLRRLREGLGPLAPEGIVLLAEAHRKTDAEANVALGELGAWLERPGGAA
jgi:hypothetical protein